MEKAVMILRATFYSTCAGFRLWRVPSPSSPSFLSACSLTTIFRTRSANFSRAWILLLLINGICAGWSIYSRLAVVSTCHHILILTFLWPLHILELWPQDRRWLPTHSLGGIVAVLPFSDSLAPLTRLLDFWKGPKILQTFLCHHWM